MTSTSGLVGSLVAIAVLVGLTTAANAADLDPAGVWMVVSYTAQDQQTGVTTFPFGEQPTGSAIYTSTGHMSILVTARARASEGDWCRKRCRARNPARQHVRLHRHFYRER